MFDGETTLKIGDKIQILGIDFIITGVEKGLDFPFANICIPNSTFDNMIGSVDSTNAIIIEFASREERLANMPKISEFLTEKGIEFSNLSYAEMKEDAEKNNNLYRFKNLLILLAVIPYTLISLANILDCKNEEDKIGNAARLMVGAKRKQLYLKSFYELMILTVIAIIFCMVILAVYEGINRMNGYDSYEINLFSVFGTSGLSFIITLLISSISFYKLRKLSILEILRKA
jgi:hypothetical protein